MRYESSSSKNVWFRGTGFLININSNTIITAGHNVLDWDERRRSKHAVEVIAIFGYFGQKDPAPGLVRRARHIAVAWDFYERDRAGSDFAVITLDAALDERIVQLLDYRAFAASEATFEMTVAGFPFDLPTIEEGGKTMYEGSGKG
jgi:V8-like Glu-specific endopeptidase